MLSIHMDSAVFMRERKLSMYTVLFLECVLKGGSGYPRERGKARKRREGHPFYLPLNVPDRGDKTMS